MNQPDHPPRTRRVEVAVQHDLVPAAEERDGLPVTMLASDAVQDESVIPSQSTPLVVEEQSESDQSDPPIGYCADPRYVRLACVPTGETGSSVEPDESAKPDDSAERYHAVEPYDDATLGKLIAGRDPAAIEELYDRHGAASYRLARRVVADEQLAHDVVQEVFLAIWRGAAVYDGSRGSLSTWLFSLTHHKAVDAVRRAQRHSGRRAPEEILITEPDPAPTVEEQALASVRRDQVRAALDTLPEPQRKALLLAYFGGYSQSEIAQLSGTPLGTVKTRTLAALRRLRVALADDQLPAAMSEGEGV